MEEFGKVIFAVFGGIITLAIVSVVLSKSSQSPQVIQAGSTALAAVVAAAVAPVSKAATNGNLGANAFSSVAAPINFGPFGGLSQ